MKLIETLQKRAGPPKVRDIAELFGVTPEHIYKMTASGKIPSFRISGSVRFDPGDVAVRSKEKQSSLRAGRRSGSQSALA